MKHISNMLILTLVFGLVLIGSNAFAQDEETNKEFCGCLNSSGELKNISVNDPPNGEPLKPCKSNEEKVCWNQQGIPGTDGADGVDGKDGADGADAPVVTCPFDVSGFFDRFDVFEVTDLKEPLRDLDLGQVSLDSIRAEISGTDHNGEAVVGEIRAVYYTLEEHDLTGAPAFRERFSRHVGAIIFAAGDPQDVRFEDSINALSFAQLDACFQEIRTSANPRTP